MLIPFRDRDPMNIFPIVTVLIIAANVLVFVYELYLMAEGQLRVFFVLAAMIPYNVTHHLNAHTALTFLTSMFMHGGWMHLIGNMLYLSIFGNNVEGTLGQLPYLIFYLACGVAASMAQIAIDPTSPIPHLGASGAIAGVLGAYIVTYPKARIRAVLFIGLIRLITLPAFVVLGLWFVLQLFRGVGSLGAQTGGGVAYFAHIGGFVVGALLMAIINLVDRAG
jgi:membrane associated rhomboid family serine protease